jgi:hypothetical protein
MSQFVAYGMATDFQQQRVYRWEDTLPTGKHIPFDQISSYTDRVWSEMGLKYPPKVKPMPKQMRKNLADANRETVRFREEGCVERIILHELAHSMTMRIDGLGHQHNDVFVGVYMKLMEKFLNISPLILWFSAKKFGVEFELNANVRITDDQVMYG